MVLVHDGRGDVEGATPDLDLLLTMLFRCLSLVESCQAAVVAFIQAPGTDNGHPHLVCSLHDGPQGLDGTLQHGGVAHIKLHASLLDSQGTTFSLLPTLLTKVGIKPATEAVLLVPGTLAMADDNQTMDSSHVDSVCPVVLKFTLNQTHEA